MHSLYKWNDRDHTAGHEKIFPFLRPNKNNVSNSCKSTKVKISNIPAIDKKCVTGYSINAKETKRMKNEFGGSLELTKLETHEQNHL